MLALLLQRELETAIADKEITVEEAIDELKAIRMQEIKRGDATLQNIPSPTETRREILEKTATTLPRVLPKITANVHTKKKLQYEKNHN
ncbi:MAG: hypothetical protein QNK24_00480 [Desulfuromusa sp.]|nr:hypothetical protein [Desulfuromusa sp.]